MSLQQIDFNGRGFQVLTPSTAQKVAVAVASAQSVAIGSNVNVVELRSSTDCYIKFGTNPTAETTSSTFLPANETRYYGITPSHKIAVIRSSADGTLYITEGA